MGVVYLVNHSEIGSKHAMKVVAVASAMVSERMLREARVQGSLRHPNIVAVSDLVDAMGAPAVVMEFVEGTTLDKALKERHFSFEELDHIVTSVLHAVAFAHSKGVIHRDLKPANILLDMTGPLPHPKVTDFGLAKLLGNDEVFGQSNTRSGTSMGTPSYMSPEQIRDAKRVDARADVFSLGALLYEVFTGKRAFSGADTMEVFTKVVSGTYAPLPPIYDGMTLPDRVVDAVTAALRIDPDHRPKDAGELLKVWKGEQTIERMSDTGLTSAPYTMDNVTTFATLDAPVPASPSPNRLKVAAIGGTLLTLVALLAWVIGSAVNETPAPEPVGAVEALVEMAAEEPVEEPVVEPVEEPVEEPVATSPKPIPQPVVLRPTPTAAPRPLPVPAVVLAPEEPAVPTGTLSIAAVPKSAVVVDGIPKGNTPWKGPVSPGPHQVTLQAPDGTSKQLTATVFADSLLRKCWDFDNEAACR
jgi:serine/threonine-protein kinase